MSTVVDILFWKRGNFLDIDVLIDGTTGGKSAKDVLFTLLETWHFGDDGFLDSCELSKLIDFVVKNVPNDIDQFFRDSYSKVLRDLFQKSNKPFFLLQNSQKLFGHVLIEELIMKSDIFKFVLAFELKGWDLIQTTILETFGFIVFLRQARLEEVVCSDPHCFEVVEVHGLLEAGVGGGGNVGLEVKGRWIGGGLGEAEFGGVLADYFQLLLGEFVEVFGLLSDGVHSEIIFIKSIYKN